VHNQPIVLFIGGIGKICRGSRNLWSY